jgi:hypothetical protein
MKIIGKTPIPDIPELKFVNDNGLNDLECSLAGYPEVRIDGNGLR